MSAQLQQKEKLKAQAKAEAEATLADKDTKPAAAADEPPAVPAKDQAEAPVPPPRPKSPFTQGLIELRQAFPDGDEAVTRAVLVAAGGNLEQAFNGMLALTDETIRPLPREPEVKRQQAQIEKDELLARQLASRYQHSERRQNRARQEAHEGGEAEGVPGDIDFNEIRENFQRGLNETTRRVGSLFSQLRDRFNSELNADNDADLYDDEAPPQPTRRADTYRQHQAERARHATGDVPPRQPPRPARPVNAFGDDTQTRWEPLRTDSEQPQSDAFFIGESDEELEAVDSQTATSGTNVDAGSETKAADTDAQPLKDTEDSAESKASTKDVKEGEARDVKGGETKDVKGGEAKDVKDGEAKNVKDGEAKDVKGGEAKDVKDGGA